MDIIYFEIDGSICEECNNSNANVQISFDNTDWEDRGSKFLCENCRLLLIKNLQLGKNVVRDYNEW